MGGSSPNSDVCVFYFKLVLFLCFFVVVHVYKKKKKMDRGVGGCSLANLSFSRIFRFFNLAKPLTAVYFKLISYCFHTAVLTFDRPSVALHGGDRCS